MRLFVTAVLLILIISMTTAQGTDTTEGGNVTGIDTNGTQSTIRWAAIVGWLNGSFANASNPISFQNVSNATVFVNYPNGSYANLSNTSMILTRLSSKPNLSYVSTPNITDFNESGMFSTFSVFSGLNFSNVTDDPRDTFCALSCNYMTCYLDNISFSCPYITLLPNIQMGILKYDDGVDVEPLFIVMIDNQQGFNGTFFDFESMVPSFEYYYFYASIRPDIPPSVVIHSPLPITYHTTTIPLAYTISDADGIDTCWYVLDGTNYSMPVCGPAYILDVTEGDHSLTLYANDTLGNIGSDSVNFTVEILKPPTPKPPFLGGGPAGTPIYQPLPPIPPPPPPPFFGIEPEMIHITVNYPDKGIRDFTLTSTIRLDNVSCFVRGDFENYTTVEINSYILEENQTMGGTITVDMSPQEILDYEGSLEAVLQCVGKTEPTLISSTTVKVLLTLNKPAFEVENVSAELLIGEEQEITMFFTNVGEGNATAADTSVRFPNYPFLFQVIETTQGIRVGEQGHVKYRISIPSDMEPGGYLLPVDIYESDRLAGRGYLSLNVLPVPVIPPIICAVPDLLWTIIILLAGLVAAAIVFKKKLREQEELLGMTGEKLSGLGRYKVPLAYALFTFAVFAAVWFIILALLAKCS